MVKDPLVVVIDPGHGGPEAYGAMWPPIPSASLQGEALHAYLLQHARRAAAVEKDIALNIALALAHALEGSGWPVCTELTRDLDEATDLDTRAAVATKHGADLVVSIHCDTATDPTVSGLCVYVRDHDPLASDIGRRILGAAPRELDRGTTEPRVCKPLPHWTGRAHNVLSRHTCPALLVECGFLSHHGDRDLLTCQQGQALVVSAIMAGVAGLAWHWSTSRSAAL